jgi:hypothetical protein
MRTAMSLKLPNALELADFWNRNAERWTSVTGTALSKPKFLLLTV